MGFLNSSIMFTIGVQLKTYQSPDDAITAMQRDGLEVIYEEGRKRIDRLIKQAKMRQVALVDRLLQTENVFYAATIVDDVKAFFKLYYPEFMAHEMHITADYPVYNKTEKLLGIEYFLHVFGAALL